MALYRKSGGSNIAPTIIRRRSGGAWADVQTIYRRASGAWVKVYSAYTPITLVTISGNPDAHHGSSTVMTASANGSSTSKSFAWSKQSGAGTLQISGSASSAAVRIADSGAPTSGDTTAVFRCTVSDGVSSAYADVTVSGIGTV